MEVADRVSLFLSQIISHMDLYGCLYPSQWAMVVAITTVLKEEAVDWVTDLHNDHAKELANVGLFLEALRGRFEDNSRTQWKGSLWLCSKEDNLPETM